MFKYSTGLESAHAIFTSDPVHNRCRYDAYIKRALQFELLKLLRKLPSMSQVQIIMNKRFANFGQILKTVNS